MKILIYTILIIIPNLCMAGVSVVNTGGGRIVNSGSQLDIGAIIKNNNFYDQIAKNIAGLQQPVIVYQVGKQDGITKFKSAYLSENNWNVQNWQAADQVIYEDPTLKKALEKSADTQKWQDIKK